MIVLGNLVADLESKQMKDKLLVTGRIAVRDPYKQESDFFDFEAWGPTASYLQRFAVKGTMLLLEGTPKMEVWHDKEQNFRSRFKLAVRESSVVQRGKDHQQERPAGNKPQHQNKPAPQPAPASTEETEDIPF